MSRTKTFRILFFLIGTALLSSLSLCRANNPSAQQDDPKRLAMIAVAEGKLLQAQGTADALRKANESYQRALTLYRSINDQPGEAEALSQIAVVQYLLGNKQKALDLFRQELELWQAMGDQRREAAEALNNIGVVYGSLGQEQKAIDSYQQALPLRRAAGDRAGLANTLDNIGMFYLNTGQLQNAFDYFNQALTLFRELNEKTGIANSVNNLGGVHLTWGDYKKAREFFVEALKLRHELGQRREEAMALNNIGQVHYFLGEAQQALDFHRKALELRRKLGQQVGIAVSINNIGFVYDWMGEHEEALDHYKQALELFRLSTDRNGEAATLNNIGAYYLNNLQDTKTALEYYTRSLGLRRALQQPIEEATMLANIGLLHMKKGDPRQALEHHKQALTIRRARGHRLGEAASLNNLGATYFSIGELQLSRDYFDQALTLHRKMGSRSFEAATLLGIARVERERGNLAEALVRIEESLDIIESLRGRVASQELRASYLAKQQEYYEFYTDVLLRLHQREPSKGYDLAALKSSERARARSLLELLAEARIDVDRGISPELKQRERAVHSRIASIQKRLVEAYSEANLDPTRISKLEAEMKQVDGEREILDMEIRQKHPRYANLQYPAPLGLKAIQSLLDDQTVLLEYAVGKDHSFLLVVTHNGFSVARLSPPKVLTDLVEALRPTITLRPQRSMLPIQIEYSRKLYRELIEPAGELLTGKRKLIIVPSGILHYLPFEVLLSSGKERTLAATGTSRLPYLLRDYSISYVPSAGVLAGLRNQSRAASGPDKTFLAFADPIYVKNSIRERNVVERQQRGAFGDEQSWKLENLTESRREVEQIAALFAKEKVSLLLGEQASEENVKTTGRFEDYRYIHFATHGLLNENRPHYSGLILSLTDPREGKAAETKPGVPPTKVVSRGNNDQYGTGSTAAPQSEDGLLQVYEVFNLKLNAELVVLSACETGLGKEVKGEGLIGLTHAFFYAGTSSVLVSLWKVQDRSTADLMVHFYQQLESKNQKGEALRQAKLKLIQNSRYSHPYYWAPFVLIGEAK